MTGRETPSGEAKCPAHSRAPAVTRCFSCGVPLCQSCWRHEVDGTPCCEPCLGLLRAPSPPVLYIIGFATTAVLLALSVRKLPLEPLWGWLCWVGATLFAAYVAIRMYQKAERRRLALRVRQAPAARRGASTRGGSFRRAIRRAAPPVSGRMATFVVGSSLLLAALVLPRVVDLPRWIEVELVLAGWWVVWSTAFAVLLYKGWRLAQDHRGFAKPGRSEVDAMVLPDPSGCADDGILFILGAALVAFLAALTAAFVAVELLVPLVLSVAYWLLIRGLSRVANDEHGCRGRLGRSVAWGAAWATVYTGPLALLVWLVVSVVPSM